MTVAFDPDLVQRAATVVLNLVVAVAVGAALTRMWMARLGSPWAQLQVGRARRIAIAALVVAMLSSGCGIWIEAAAMAEVPLAQAGAQTWTMVTATHLGAAWQAGMAALVVSLVAMALASPARRAAGGTLVGLAGIALFLYTRSMVSHASAAGDVSAMMLVDWVHLMLVSVWVGEVLMAGLVVLRTLPAAGRAGRADCAHYVKSLSASATVALVGIFATGLANAWYNLGSAAALTSTQYGITLLVKLALVLAAATLGGINRFIVMPGLIDALHTAPDQEIAQGRRFALVLRIEAMLLLGALVVAAVLSATSPPAAG